MLETSQTQTKVVVKEAIFESEAKQEVVNKKIFEELQGIRHSSSSGASSTVSTADTKVVRNRHLPSYIDLKGWVVNWTNLKSEGITYAELKNLFESLKTKLETHSKAMSECISWQESFDAVPQHWDTHARGRLLLVENTQAIHVEALERVLRSMLKQFPTGTMRRAPYAMAERHPNDQAMGYEAGKFKRVCLSLGANQDVAIMTKWNETLRGKQLEMRIMHGTEIHVLARYNEASAMWNMNQPNLSRLIPNFDVKTLVELLE